MSLPYRGEMIDRARELRKNMTQQERKLWYLFLSKYLVRFQRQKIISGFVVDFFCAKANLAIEIDGNQHHSEHGEAYDFDRTVILGKYHVEVIRFNNDDIESKFSTVCKTIDEAVRTKVIT